MNNILYLDTHANKTFKILYNKKIYHGEDVSKDIAKIFELCALSAPIKKIVFLRGPGSFTSLRIGSAFALAYALSKNITILGMRLLVLLSKEFPKYNIYFYTGTKKWLKVKNNKTEIIESGFDDTIPWLSNAPHLIKLNNNISYPEIVLLMEKHKELANSNLNLIYPITVFG